MSYIESIQACLALCRKHYVPPIPVVTVSPNPYREVARRATKPAKSKRSRWHGPAFYRPFGTHGPWVIRPEVEAEIVRLKQEGLSQRKIARAVRASTTTVLHVLKRRSSAAPPRDEHSPDSAETAGAGHGVPA